MPVYDFRCPYCSHLEQDVIAKLDEEVKCLACSEKMERLACAPHILTTIVPTYPGSKKHKAGYVHLNKNEPATRTQIGYGGGQSPENPKGSK
jgi:predicted house-cleaning noncanonical NTP pyrophosphatase (MazG superfamily)